MVFLKLYQIVTKIFCRLIRNYIYLGIMYSCLLWQKNGERVFWIHLFYILFFIIKSTFLLSIVFRKFGAFYIRGFYFSKDPEWGFITYFFWKNIHVRKYFHYTPLSNLQTQLHKCNRYNHQIGTVIQIKRCKIRWNMQIQT